MAYEKLLNEIYAALSLKYLWPEYKPHFIKSESPDWINEQMDLGLEVSQALLPDDGQMESFIEKFLGKKKEELPPEALARYGERLHFYNGRFWAVLPDEQTEQDYVMKAKFRFDRKLEKLNTNYQCRKYNGLYLFLHPTKEKDIDAGQLYEYMEHRQKQERRRFDWVFLNCIEIIYVCNHIKNRVEKIVLPPNAGTFLDEEAERQRRCKVWENGDSLDVQTTS